MPILRSLAITAPSAGGSIISRTNGIPAISQRGVVTRVCNTELLFSPFLGALGAFVFNKSSLIPANFTWLNGIATNFSKHRWVRVWFIYVPVVPTTTAGRFAMAFSYDIGDADATSVQEIQMTANSVTTPVWGGFEGSCLLHDTARRPDQVPGAVVVQVDTSRQDKLWYKYINLTDYGTIGLDDRNQYGPGQLWMGSSGGVAGATGDVFVSYEIDLIEPIPGARN
jgi:hypothetical protein